MSATDDTRVVPPGGGRAFSTGRSDVRVKIESAEARSFAAFEAAPLPGVPGPPQHVHRAYDEAWYVMDGEMTFHLGADAHQCVAGSVVFAPRGTPHTFSTGSSPARVLVIITAQALPLRGTWPDHQHRRGARHASPPGPARRAPDVQRLRPPHRARFSSWRARAPSNLRNEAAIGMLTSMIGRLEKTVLDSPEPRALAAFYAEVLGMRINEDSDDWVVIGRGPGWRELAFQRAATWVPPRWPDPQRPQQLHLDIRVDDVDAAERAVLTLGARRLPAEHEQGFRVFADPVGHPFCLVFG